MAISRIHGAVRASTSTAIVVTLIPTVDQARLVVEISRQMGCVGGIEAAACPSGTTIKPHPISRSPLFANGWTGTDHTADTIHHGVVNVARTSVRSSLRVAPKRRPFEPLQAAAPSVSWWVGDTVPLVRRCGACDERLGVWKFRYRQRGSDPGPFSVGGGGSHRRTHPSGGARCRR
jgi:hypothetical protein